MSTPGKSAGAQKSAATSNKSSGKKKSKEISTAIGRFSIPSMKNIKLDENIFFEFALENDYTTLFGALDGSSHPLTRYLIEEGLFIKRNEEGKTAFDLAATIGNKEFLRGILERIGEKLNESEFDVRTLLNPEVAYNFMHHACIWGRLDLCRTLVLFDNSKRIKDPSEFKTAKTDEETEPNETNPKMIALASIFLKTKTKYGETPKNIAERYDHIELINFLNYAEKRQVFLDGLKKIESYTKQPESDFTDPVLLRKFKDARKKLEKLLSETNVWLDENKEIYEISLLNEKMIEIDEFALPFIGKPIFE